MYFPVASPADLELARYHHLHSADPLIRQRMHYLCLRSQGYGPGQCAKILNLHPNTATRWSKLYCTQGLSGLLSHQHYRPLSELQQHTPKISADFDHQPPRSVAQARQRIEQLTGLQRGLTQVRRYLKQTLGFKCRRYRCLPGGNKSIEELAALQHDFVQQTLLPLVERAACEQIDLYFVDAAHPVQGFHGGQVWSKQPLAIRTASGRQRVNILGALDVHHQELYSITTNDYIQATTVVELLEHLDTERRAGAAGTAAAVTADHPETARCRRPMHLVLDNARYQRCQLVQETAQRLDIQLVYLPPYSPNLNLIERFWKFLKKHALAGYYYATKQDFCEAIDWFIEEVNNGEYQNELRTLLAPNFQILKPLPSFSPLMAV